MEINFLAEINSDSQAEIARVLDRLVPEGERLHVLEYLSGGWGNLNYRIEMAGEHYALRISQSGQQNPDHEIRYMQIENAPELIAYDLEEKHLITRWIEGYVPDDHPLSPSEAAKFLRQLHRVLPTGIAAYGACERILRMYSSGNASNEDIRLFTAIGWEPRSIYGCHNDLNPWNLLVTPQGVRTLDWESAGDNEPLFDLVGLTYGMRFDDDQTVQCASEYLDFHPDLLYLIDTRIAYLCREHAWAIEQVAFGNARSEVRHQIQESREEILRLYQLRENL